MADGMAQILRPAFCQEASAASHETYIPCGRPAQFIVRHPRNNETYPMCDACADHNVRNRGAVYVLEGEPYQLTPIAPPDAPTPKRYTIDEVQQAYFAAKDVADLMSKRHQEEMAPLTQKLEVCRAWMLDYLNKQGLENAKTEHGLTYKSSVMSATVDPDDGWPKILRFALEKALGRVLEAIENGAEESQGMDLFLQEPALTLLNRSVNKTSVKELLDQGVEVPGVKISHITQVNVRRN